MVTGGLKSGHCVILIAFKRCASRRWVWGESSQRNRGEWPCHISSFGRWWRPCAGVELSLCNLRFHCWHIRPEQGKSWVYSGVYWQGLIWITRCRKNVDFLKKFLNVFIWLHQVLAAWCVIFVMSPWHTSLVAPRHMGSSQTRDQTHVPCIGRQILNHWATREVPECWFLNYKVCCPPKGKLKVEEVNAPPEATVFKCWSLNQFCQTHLAPVH